MAQDARVWAFDCEQTNVLLLFKRGGTLEPVDLPGGRIPPHDVSGQIHLALAVDAAELPEWESRLADCGFAVEVRMKWLRGGTSLYFPDPDHHLVGLASPGLWANY